MSEFATIPTEEISVGARVRVADTEGKSSAAATVSYIHENDLNAAIDVIFDGAMQEECMVSLSRVSKLFDFEQQVDEPGVASVCKDCGNLLFGARDFDAASRYYLKGLELLVAREKLSVGSQVLVMTRRNFVDGMVSGVDAAKAQLEVELDDDEELLLAERDAIPLRTTAEDLKLQRSLYLNLAKCSHKKALKGWAVRYSGIAVAIATFALKALRLSGDEEKDAIKGKADSHFFRGKVLLEACRPYNAEKDYKELLKLDVAKAGQLRSEIARFKEKRQKENKKLAKEIAKWIDTAVTQSHSGDSKDIDIVDDEEEERVRTANKSETKQALRPKPHENKSKASLITFVGIAVLLLAALLVLFKSSQPCLD